MFPDIYRSHLYGGLALPLAAIGSVLAGLSLVERPLLAGVLVAGVAAVGLAASSLRKPIAAAILLLALAISASVDILGRVAVGPTSAYAWVTAGMVAVLLIVVFTGTAAKSHHTGASRAVFLVALFPVYAVMSIFWYSPTLAAAQNVLVYLAFALVLTVAMRAASSGEVGFGLLRKALFWVYFTAACLYVGSLALGGLSGGTVIGSRSYALFAVTGVAWGVALARCGYRREAGLAALSLLLVLLSLSRLAFAAGLLIVLLAALDFRTVGRINRSIVLVVLVALVGYSAIAWFSPFTQRFSSGDVVSIAGGVSTNVEGRGELWSITWNSAMSSPWFGSGAGSSEEVIAETILTPSHPHNDYLRIFHDFGTAGLLLFSVGLLALFRLTWSRFGSTTSNAGRALHLAAILELIVLFVSMTTDNVVVYLFFVIPIAVVVGVSVGLPNAAPPPHR